MRLVRWLYKPTFWFAVALLIRMLYLLEQGGTSPLFYQPLLDEKEAVDAALAILRGHVAAEPYFKAPAYSWIMAAVMAVTGGAWPWTVRALQHLAGAYLVWLASSLAGMISPARSGKWAIATAGALAALYGPMIRLEDNLSLDFWVVFFQSFMLYMLVIGVLGPRISRRSLLIAGVLAAAAWLTRPTITLVLPFLAAWVVWTGWSRGQKYSLVNMAVFLLPVVAAACFVLGRNAIISGQPLLMPWQGGYSLYYANRPGANGRYFLQSDLVQNGPEANPTRQLAIEGYRASLSPAAAASFDAGPSYSAVNSYWLQKTFSFVRTNPGAAIRLFGRKLVYLFSDKEIYNYEDFDLQRQLSPVLRWLPGRFGAVLPLALVALAFLGILIPRKRSLHVLLWIYIITLGGSIAIYYVSGRMRMPLAFPIIVLAGVSAAGVWCLPPPRKTIALVLLGAGIFLSWTDWWGVRSESMAYADLARMSNAAWHRQRYDQALDLAVQSENLDPTNPLIHRLKAQALYGLGRLSESKAEFQKSIQALNDDSSKKNIKIIEQQMASPQNSKQ